MNTNRFREVRYPGSEATLYLHSMPGRYEPFSEALVEIKERGISSIICLAGMEEIESKSPPYAAAIRYRLLSVPTFRQIPVRDFGVPHEQKEVEQYLAALEQTQQDLERGKHVLVHCGAGVGRTGTFACALLVKAGLSLDDALDAVQRAGSGPETAEQMKFLGTIRDFQD